MLGQQKSAILLFAALGLSTSFIAGGCGSKPVAPPAGAGAGAPAPGPAAAAAPSPAPQPPAASPQVASSTAAKNSPDNAPAPTQDTSPAEENHDHFLVLRDADDVAPRFSRDEEAGTTNADTFLAYSHDGKVNSTVFVAASVPARATGSAPTPAADPVYGAVKQKSEVSPGQLPEGFEPVEDAAYTEDGWPLRIRNDRAGTELVLIPEGAGIQGIDASDIPEAGPAHPVQVDPYYIEVREVTSSQWAVYRDLRKAEGKKAKAAGEPARKSTAPDEPVAGVTWAEAGGYAEFFGMSLPTEAQWERAARGPEGFAHPWGNGVAVWERARTPALVSPVASYRGDVSPYGLFDTAGNVREWCSDWYTPDYYAGLVKAGSSVARNPTGGRNVGNQRVVKGGDARWRVAARSGVVQTERPADIGFRCVLNLRKPKESRSEGATKDAPPSEKKAAPKKNAIGL